MKANLLRLKLPEVNKKRVDEWEKLYSSKDPWHYLGKFNERIRNKIIIDLVRWSKCKKALDIACGEGTLTYAISPYIEHIDAFDISSNAIEYAKQDNAAANINYFQLDLKDFSGDMGIYDFILCTEVLYYLQPDEIAILLDKIKKSLGNNSYFVLTTRVVIEDAQPSESYFKFEDVIEILQQYFTIIAVVPVYRPEIFSYKAVKRTFSLFSPLLDNIYKGWLTSMNPKRAAMCAYVCIRK